MSTRRLSAAFATLIVLAMVESCCAGPQESHTLRVTGVAGHPGMIAPEAPEAMKYWLKSTKGVTDVVLAGSGDSRDKTITVTYNPEVISRKRLIDRARELAEVSWYECKCGKTSATPVNCCGSPMAPRH